MFKKKKSKSYILNTGRHSIDSLFVTSVICLRCREKITVLWKSIHFSFWKHYCNLAGCADTANKHVAPFKCAGCNWIWLQTFVSHLQLLQHNVHHMTFPWGLMAVDEDGRVTVLLGLKKGECITLFKDLSNHIIIYCIFNICIFMNKYLNNLPI